LAVNSSGAGGDAKDGILIHEWGEGGVADGCGEEAADMYLAQVMATFESGGGDAHKLTRNADGLQRCAALKSIHTDAANS